MFTGLVEFVGETRWLRRTSKTTQLMIHCPDLAKKINIGDSISVNGCCLTVVSHREGNLNFDLLEETLNLTNLKNLRPESPVNLERALAANARLGGHFVQGHVDCTATIQAREKKDSDLRLDLSLHPEFAQYVAYKGSIAVNGVSLTVAEVTDAQFSIWIIPHTLKNTNLRDLHTRDIVNLEFDILAKYTERILDVKRA